MTKTPNLEEKHNYDYWVGHKGDAAPVAVLDFIKEGSRVLEIGAGSGGITKHLVGRKKCKVVALEINPASVAKLRAFCKHVYQMDLNANDWTKVLSDELSQAGEAAKFDYVIAADVLEHLYDPWQVLQDMTKLLNENGRVITSLPHAGHSSVVASFYNGDVEMREWGLLDKTHIRFFGIKNIQSLYASAGLAITKCHFVLRHPEETEVAHQFNALPRPVKDAISGRAISDIYQVVTEGVPLARAETQIRLADILPKGEGMASPRPNFIYRMLGR